MPKVLVLPDHIASQIAAGEVIERPSSVVKELVENSIDAGATHIEISINSECRDIRVADNGCGMDAEDAVLAFQRHATSKISSAEDLWSLRSMGFRGEALPSISSIAQVTCLSRAAGATVGVKIQAAEGKITTAETGCAPGTVMEITDLFYNVPARLKFLKKAGTEFAHIQEIVQSLAIAFPKITFQLLNRQETVLRTSGSDKLSQAMLEAGLLNGREELCPVDYTDPASGLTIYGYLARPVHFRGDRKGILSLVNSRPVRCPLTYKALEYAYGDLIPRGKHPIAVLTITVDPRQIDINVHPTKKEIKYSQGNEVYLAIQRAVAQAMRISATSEPAQSASTSTIDSPAAWPTITYSPDSPGLEIAESPATQLGYTRSARAQQLQLHPQSTAGPRTAMATPAFASPAAGLPQGWRLLGYLKNTYFLVDTPEGLEIIEQHIAHERVLYERLLASQNTPGRLSESTQHLVVSVPLNLTPEQCQVLQESCSVMQNLGFDFEFSGAGNLPVTCTQVPVELAHKDYATVVQSLIEEIALTDKAQLELEATKSVACQAAVKNGMSLSEQDIVQLIGDWWQTKRHDTCPHGRPIRLKFSMEKLFQMFHPA